ncbi:MAG: C-GCAxxG-C-C family protein [Desulfohalobiaceae bacterium]|nr:C-GCAxxG-C-C family protein [Desulfohalobiaceae bacterium]
MTMPLLPWTKSGEPELEARIQLLSERARNLFQTRQYLCSEAVVVTLNHGLSGGLTESQAVSLAAPFSMALGGSGCLCGALSGGVIASGLFLGREQPHRHRRAIRNKSKQLHDAFRAANGATCCRVLCKHVKQDKSAHFRQCAALTAGATELAARLIFHERPELLNHSTHCDPAKRPFRVSGFFIRLYHYLTVQTF